MVNQFSSNDPAAQWDVLSRGGQGTPLSVPDLVKRYRTLKKDFLARQKEENENVLASNLAAVEAFATARLQGLAGPGPGAGGGAATGGAPAPQASGAPAPSLHQQQHQQQQQAHGGQQQQQQAEELRSLPIPRMGPLDAAPAPPLPPSTLGGRLLPLSTRTVNITCRL
ncbi:hypothetical protein Agub_g11271, partial [Astrephomene gubernaculifera]